MMTLRQFTPKQKFGATAGVVIAVFALAGSAVLPIHSWVIGIAERLQGYGAAGALLFVFIYVVGTMALVPASAFSLAAGLLYGIWGILLAWLAMMTVAGISFPLAAASWPVESVAWWRSVGSFARWPR